MYALRLKKIVFVNCPPYISILIAILKAVMKPKIFERVEFHQDTGALKNFIPEEDFPSDYGGKGPSLEDYNGIIFHKSCKIYTKISGMMLKKLSEYQNRFDELDKLRVNESLRPEKLDNDEILGFYGSFKKINLD